MQVTFATLADAANVTDTGKLNLLGAFQVISPPAVPHQHPLMTLVLTVRFSPDEMGTTIPVRVYIRNPEGRPIFDSNDLPVEVQNVPDLVLPMQNLLLNFQGLQFMDFGPHVVEITGNGERLTEVPLDIRPRVIPRTD